MYHLGEWLLPLLAVVLQDWRLLYASIAACSLATAGLAVWLPESPRWQLLHGHEKQAVKTLRWLARLNGRSLPDSIAQQLVHGGTDSPADSQEKDPSNTEPEGMKPQLIAASGQDLSVMLMMIAQRCCVLNSTRHRCPLSV